MFHGSSLRREGRRGSLQAALLKYTFRVSLARSQARSREPVTQAVMFVTAHGGLTALGGPVTPAGRLQSRLESRLGSRLEPRRAVTPSVSAVEPELQPGAGHGSFALSANPKPEAGPYLTQTAASQAGQNDPARSCPACLWPAGARARAGTAQASRLARVRRRDQRPGPRPRARPKAWPASAGATKGAKRRAAVRWRPGPEKALRTASSQTQTAVRVAGSAARTARIRRPEAGPGGLEDGRFGNAFLRREMRRGSPAASRVRPVRQRAHASLDAIGKNGRCFASVSGPEACAFQPLLIQPAPPRGDQSDSSDSALS